MIVCICANWQPKQRVNNVYYLPGDIRRVIYPYNIDIEQFNEAWENVKTFMKHLIESMQPILENMVMEFRKIAMLSQFQDSKPIKDAIKELEEKYLPRELLARPLKSIKAVNLNRRVNKIIYYHIRSNC